MDQGKETENVQVADSVKPEKVQGSHEVSNNVPSSEQPPSDKPQDQPTPNQSSSKEISADMHSTERLSSEKTLDQPSSENTPGKTEDQTPNDQRQTHPPNTNDGKSGKDLQPLGNESSTKETEVDPAPITQSTEEQKPTSEKSEEGQHPVSEQDPNANDHQVSNSNTETSPEQLKPGVQEVHIADGPSAKATEAKDTALSNSVDSNDKTEEQSPTLSVKEIDEHKVEDSADTKPPAEATSQKPEANLDNLQKSPSMDDTIAKQQAPTDHQPTVESIPNKDEDAMHKVQKEEVSSPDKDAVQGESPAESNIETQDKTTKSQDEEEAATPENKDGGKESLKAPVEEVTNAPVEELGATGKVDTEGPRLRFGKATEDEKRDEKEPKEEMQEEGDPGATGDFSNVGDQERKPKEEISDVLSDLLKSLNSPVVCGLVVFALLVFVVLLRCLFSLNAICYTLLFYSVLIIFGYPLTLYMVRNNLDRSVIRVVVGIFCLLFSILFYKCRPTITWMTEISELL